MSLAFRYLILAKAEEARKEAEAKEAQRKREQAGDREKLELFWRELGSVSIPTIRNEKMQSILSDFLNDFLKFEKAVKEI